MKETDRRAAKRVLSQLIKEHDDYRQTSNSVLLYKLLINIVLKTLIKKNVSVINKKNKRSHNLQPKQSRYNYSKVLIINLSSVHSIDISSLEHGLRLCFVDQNQHIKKFETLCSFIDKDISLDDKEIFSMNF